MSRLTFDGFDADGRKVLYRGPMGTEYALDPTACSDVYKFVHGDRVVFRKGPHKGKTVVVMGVHNGKALVVHDEADGGAFFLPNCSNYTELHATHEPEGTSGSLPARAELNGPLNFRYALNADPRHLEGKYGLAPGSRVHIESVGGDCTVVGEFLNCVWVTVGNQRGAVPVVGGTHEQALLNLHGLRDRDASGATSPRTPRTPGRARGAAFTVDEAKGVARCQVAMGGTVEVAITNDALAPFGVTHMQRVVATQGIDAGKVFVVIGVKGGVLYIVADGERRAVCCRNCANAADLAKVYGFETTPAGSPRRTESVTPRSTAPSSPRGDASPDGSLSPRRDPNAVPKPCWTAHGRVYFDTSAAACGVFGVAHGQTVRATKGGDAGAVFHVFGVRHGTLWVVPDGKQRATALRHCKDKDDVGKLWGFVGAGKRDMAPYQTPVEPVKTRLPGELEKLASLSPRRDQDDTPPRAAPVVHSPPRQTQAAPVAVPTLPLHRVAREAEADAASLPVPAPAAGSHGVPADRTREATPFRPGAMPATRHYLKAYAALMTKSRDHDTAFHGYFGEKPRARLGAAMDALPQFASHWAGSEAGARQCAFGNATTAEMLEGMQRAQHLFAGK